MQRKYSNADMVIASSNNKHYENALNEFLAKSIPGVNIQRSTSPFVPYPSFDLLTKIDYICLLGSWLSLQLPILRVSLS